MPSRTRSGREPNKWAVLVTVLLMTFMGCLDSSIVNVALPVMSRDLGVELNQIQWVSSIYLVVNCASVLLFGRMGDLFGKVRIFQCGVLLFTAGSLLCALSSSLPALIAARVVQSLGASAALANNQGIITEAFPPSERGRSLGFVASFVALGTLTGPVLGGLIVGATSWECIFLINVPVGIAGFVAGLRTLPVDAPEPAGTAASASSPRARGLRSLDLPGTALMATSLMLVFCSLTLLEQSASPAVWGALAVGLALLVAFIAYELHAAEPLMRLEVFRDLRFDVNLVTMLIVFTVFGANNLLLPFFLQDACGFSVTLAGLIMAAYPLVNFFVGPTAGRLSDRIGCELPTMLGLAVFGAGTLLLSLLSNASPVPAIVATLMVMSLGSSTFQSPNNSLVMSSVPRDALGFAGSMSALVRSLGMSVGIVFSSGLLYNRMSAMAGYDVSGYVDGRPELFMYGFHWVYLVLVGLVAVGFALAVWRFVRARRERRARRAR